MSRLIPMPSPRGTNYEQRYMRVRSAAGAYDSAEGLTAPEPDALGDAAAKKILELLRGKLDPADLEEVQAFLANLASGGAGMDADPLDLPGKPRTALDRLPPRLRRQAIDAVLDARRRNAEGFAERHPDAMRIGIL